jgi:hypothetical protein
LIGCRFPFVRHAAFRIAPGSPLFVLSFSLRR